MLNKSDSMATNSLELSRANAFLVSINTIVSNIIIF